MIFYRRIMLQLLGSLLTSMAAAAQGASPDVIAEVSSREIYEGQSLRYNVLVQNVGAVAPQLTGFDDFEIEFLGDRSRNDSVVVRGSNNQRTEIKRLGHEYQYQLTPKKSGRLSIPPVVVDYHGKQYKSKAITINVISAAKQDIVRLELKADRTTVYRRHSLEVSLFVQVKSLPGSFAEHNPVSLATLDWRRSLSGNNRGIRAPHLEIPWLDDEQLAPRFKPDADWQSVLVPIGNDRGIGFRINDIPGFRSLLDMVDRTYLPPSTRVQLQDTRGNSTEYWQFEFSRRLVGWQAGKCTIQPCAAQGAFGVKVSGNSLLVKNVFAKSEAITVEVLDVPAEGRPANYINLSGKISGFSSDIRPQSACVGDPLTLTLRIRGSGTLDEATPPDLASIPRIADNFRLLKPTGEMVDGQRLFTYSLRPLSADITEIPPIELTYFDVEMERFVPVRTASIAIQIGPSEQLRANQIVTPTGEASEQTDIELAEDGLFGNFTDLETFRNDGIEPVRWFIGWGGILGSYSIAWLLMGRWQRNQVDPARTKRRLAMATASQQLAKANQLMTVGRANEANRAIREAFVGLLSDVTGESAAGMTPREFLAKLQELDVPTRLATEVQDVLEHCDARRYGAATTTVNEVAAAERLLVHLASELNQRGLLS